MLYLAFSWLCAATPLWLALCVMAACGLLAWQLQSVIRRVDRHAESIAHMDEWADMVDRSLLRIEDRARRLPSSPAVSDLRKWWQK